MPRISINTILPLIVTLIILGFSPARSSGLKKFPLGISFELAGGYNQLLWHGEDFTINRTAISFAPTFRLMYIIPIGGRIDIAPFAGYNRFGGSSGVYPNGYKDEYWWTTYEFGSLLSYRIRQYKIGAGAKINKHIETKGRYYGSLNQSGNTPRSWNEEDWTSEFAGSSFDVGLRATWSRDHFRFSAESWFGGSDLLGDKWGDRATARENHFRLLIGYEL